MNTKIVVFGLVIAVVLSVGMVSALSNSGGGDWSYYKEITIKENAGNALSDYQVLVELNPSNFPDKAKSDGSDLRFAEDGKELSYWIEDYDAGAKTAKIWVKVPSIPANRETKIKMYYGNEKAGSVSDGDEVFEFFDDFESGVYLNRWTATVGTWSESAGTIKQTQNIGHNALYVTNLDISDNFIIESRIKTNSNEQFGITGRFTDLNNYWALVAHGSYDSIRSYVFDNGKEVAHQDTLHPIGDNTWYILRGSLYGQNAKLELFDSNWNPLASVTILCPSVHTGTKVGLKAFQRAEWDWFRVRKYTSLEPTVTLSREFPTKKIPSLALTKSASPSTIQEGETTTISIIIENTGSGDAKAVEVTDTIPTGFKIISGSKSASFDEIKPGDYRTLEYTLKATGSGKFTCDPATATYKDADGNSYSAASNSVSIPVGGEVPVGADSDGDGWSDEKEREMGTNPYSVDSDGDGLKDPEDPNPTVPEEKKTPGFEIVFAIAGLLAVAYLLRRRG